MHGEDEPERRCCIVSQRYAGEAAPFGMNASLNIESNEEGRPSKGHASTLAAADRPEYFVGDGDAVRVFVRPSAKLDREMKHNYNFKIALGVGDIYIHIT